MRILFITSTRLGDAVLSTGLLRHLRGLHADARFTVVCGPVAAGIFTRLPGLLRIIPLTKEKYDLHWWRLWRELAPEKFDLAIDLRGSGITFFLRASRRVIMRGGRRPGHRLNHLAAAIGVTPPPLPGIFINDGDRAMAARLFPEGAAFYVGLGPTANWDGKIWPAENFCAVLAALKTIYPNAIPVVFGGPGAQERALAAPVLAALPNTIDCVGKFSLPEIAAMLARMHIFIGNDSGLMHLAAAAGAPTLGLFGPSRAEEYAPSGICAAYIEAPGPQGAAPMAALLPARVIEAAQSLLSQAKTLVPA
jgi:ADP-heptose:LPS heptosyltransferase